MFDFDLATSKLDLIFKTVERLTPVKATSAARARPPFRFILRLTLKIKQKAAEKIARLFA
jgi:hypothetical protein